VASIPKLIFGVGVNDGGAERVVIAPAGSGSVRPRQFWGFRDYIGLD